MSVILSTQTTTNIQIHIRNDIKIKDKSIINNLMDMMMKLFNSQISSSTNVNYHAKRIRNHKIIIPIDNHTEEDSMLGNDLMEKRFNEILTFLVKFDWKQLNQEQLHLIRSCYSQGIIVDKLFELSVITGMETIKTEIINMNPPVLEFPIISRDVFTENSTITYIVDPYVRDYGVFVNLSVPFEDMGMSYNALHLYEHLMTKCWKTLDKTNRLDMNGATYPSALCYIFSIFSDVNSMKMYLASYLNWYAQSRYREFWQKHEDDVRIETDRTISETQNRRSMSTMGRSDSAAYSYSYNLDIFLYWSNKPFNILLVGPSNEIMIRDKHSIESLISRYRIQSVIRPENRKYNYFPYEVIRSKEYVGEVVYKRDKTKILQEIREGKEYLHGINCAIKYSVLDSMNAEEVSSASVLLVTLLLNLELEELKSLETKMIFPRSLSSYMTFPACI